VVLDSVHKEEVRKIEKKNNTSRSDVLRRVRTVLDCLSCKEARQEAQAWKAWQGAILRAEPGCHYLGCRAVRRQLIRGGVLRRHGGDLAEQRPLEDDPSAWAEAPLFAKQAEAPIKYLGDPA